MDSKESEVLTYAELDKQARIIAAQLQKISTPGDRALLLYPAGLDFLKAFFGCLYAGIIAIPAPFPEASRLKRTIPRLQSIVKDAQVTLALTVADILCQVEEYTNHITELKSVNWLDSKKIHTELAWQDPQLTNDKLAYLQYTSGSTSTPKGVMLTHRNVMYHCHYMQEVCQYQPESISVTWLPYFHDYGLVEGLLQPLYNGTPCYVMSPFGFMKKPWNWLQTISHYKVTHTQAPNFAYDQCVKRTKPEQIALLDLTSWRSAGNGAEPINPQVLENFYKTFAPAGLTWNACSPAYGLAEATLMVSCCSPSMEPTISYFQAEALTQNRVIQATAESKLVRAVTSCGRILPETKVVIANPDTLTQCAPDEVGEIWVASASVAQGYWQHPLATQETFQAYLTDSGEGPFLRTGDLGFILAGQLYITSRIKDLIIIGGTNHYPQDLEWTVEESHSSFRSNHCAAFSIQVEGEEKLVIAAEVERGTSEKPEDIAELFNIIRKAITREHELSVYAILLLYRGSLPKTASGKIQRSNCWNLFQTGNLDVMANSLSNNTKIPKISSINPPYTFPSAAPEISQKRADDLIDWLRHYAEERIDSRLIDERRCLPPYIILDFGNQGIMGLQIPEQYGGLGLNNRDFLRFFEQLAAIDISIASLLFIHNANGIRPLMGYATPAMRDELLPILAKGRELAAFTLTEPAAGSNLPSLGTLAIPDGKGGWKLRGVKRWNGSGWAGVINVFARTVDENGKIGHPTGFVVRQGTAGLKVGPEALTMGVRGIMQNTLYFDDVAVSPLNLLGEVNKGMDVAEEAMLIAHLCMGAVSLGGMKRCAQLMLRYAKRRQVSTGSLLDSPTIGAVFSELTIKITLLQTLLDQLATIMDEGDYPAKEVGMMTKIVSTDYLWQAADDLVETLGGRGYMENNIAPQILRDARMLRIGEGANDIMTITVGRRVFHSEELHHFLSKRLGDESMSNQLKEVFQEVQNRCLSSEKFTDRSSALSWSYSLIGKVSILGILLATANSTARYAPSESLNRAIKWAELQFETTKNKALQGFLVESFMLKTEQTEKTVNDYISSIGDVEQRPPGIEDGLDTLLRKDPVSNKNYFDLSHLPGHVKLENLAPKKEELSLEEKRALAKKLLLNKEPKPTPQVQSPEMSVQEKRNLLKKLLQNKNDQVK